MAKSEMFDLMEKILKSGELYAEFMNALLVSANAAFDGSPSHEALNEMHDRMTRRYLSLYEESVGRFLKSPQLGITREPLQHAMAATDAFNRFMAAVADFTVKFNIPLKDAFADLIHIIREKEGTGEGFKSAKEIYAAAVEILDKKYDAHIKSPQGVQLVVDVVEKYIEFKKKADIVNDIWLKSFSIPTSREMEDVYRSIYELKRISRRQAAVIRDHEALIARLTEKVEALETSLTKAGK